LSNPPNPDASAFRRPNRCADLRPAATPTGARYADHPRRSAFGHTRKAIITAILKNIDYRFEVVIPVIPGNPPANWSTLSRPD